MRVIKVRVFDKESETMFYSDQDYGDFWFCFENGKLKAYAACEAPATIDEPAHPSHRKIDCELMQFTGLRDKNGREIYEGDIVQWREVHKCCGKVDWDETCRIEWVDCGFYRRSLDDEGLYGFGDYHPEHTVVIGNIHENPDPLNP